MPLSYKRPFDLDIEDAVDERFTLDELEDDIILCKHSVVIVIILINICSIYFAALCEHLFAFFVQTLYF